MSLKICKRASFRPLQAMALLIALAMAPGLSARNSEALDYMSALSEPSQKIMADMWEYVRAQAHNKNPGQVEAKRRTLINTVANTHQATLRRPPFQGDSSYRDSVARFVETMLLILREDYAAIVNMEEVAEQSYDSMEAYLLAKKKANEKLDEAADRLTKAEQAFAERNNIKLVYTESPISKNLKKSAEVMDYYNKIYLVFFRSYKEEAYLLEAMKKDDVSKIEQSRESLGRSAKQGLKALSDISDYQGDAAVRKACRAYLEFVQTEADEKTRLFGDFILKKEMLEKLKKALDAKKQQDVTKEEADAFNAKVKDYNETLTRIKQVNAELNDGRRNAVDSWNTQGNAFIDRHVPR